MKSKMDVLQEVKSELDRFVSKINEAIKEQKDSTDYEKMTGQRKYAAARRAAIDLKHELTKLTQDGKYRYKSTTP